MNANIVIMGQSGTGKSTIVNALMGEDVARTGKGTSVTTENKIYSTTCRFNNKKYTLNLYDTVGIDVTSTAIDDIKNHLKLLQDTSSESDVNIVWFCINAQNPNLHRLYPDIDLIQKLSIEYEIPFIIVMTRSLENQIGETEQIIQKTMPEVTTAHILAKDFKLRDGINIPAYGLNDLLELSITEYSTMKVRILKSKLGASEKKMNDFSSKMDDIQQDNQQDFENNENQIKKYEAKAKACIESYSKKAGKIGWLPGGCIPFVHGLCIKMIADLNGIYGLPSSEEFASEIFTDVVVGVVATPLMAVPFLSWAVVTSYIEFIGEQYTNVLSSTVRNKKHSELSNQKLMSERIRAEFDKINKK